MWGPRVLYILAMLNLTLLAKSITQKRLPLLANGVSGMFSGKWRSRHTAQSDPKNSQQSLQILLLALAGRGLQGEVPSTTVAPHGFV